MALIRGLNRRLGAGTGTSDQVTEAERDLHRSTVDVLHELVAGMNLDNILVRPHRRWVQNYATRQAWDTLNDDQLTGIAQLGGVDEVATVALLGHGRSTAAYHGDTLR